MNRLFTFFLFLILSIFIFAGNGTKESPFSVKEMKAQKISSTDKYYVLGYVVGEFQSNSNNKLFYEMSPISNGYLSTPSFLGYVYILADSPNEYDINNCLVLQFPTTVLMEGFGLDVHPEYWRKPFIFYGSHEMYNGLDGIKKIYEFQVLDLNPINDANIWTYTEDFEKGLTSSKNNKPYEYSEFIPFNTDDKWQGGTFSRYYNDGYSYDDMLIYQYQLNNGIIDNGKPKWDDLAVSLRNENAYIELISEPENGIGELEFWAGNYEDYPNYKLSFSIQISSDNGNTWSDFISNVEVNPTVKSTTNGMTLYRYSLNLQGKDARFRILKTDSNFGKGLQIDNLKFSQFKASTALQNENDNNSIISIENNALNVKNITFANIIIYTLTGLKIYSTFTDDLTIALDKGMYILVIDNKSFKIAI